MSVQEFDPAGHPDRTEQSTLTRRQPAVGWLPAALVRHRAMGLAPLVALAGVAIAALSGVPGVADLSIFGSGCCPPHH